MGGVRKQGNGGEDRGLEFVAKFIIEIKDMEFGVYGEFWERKGWVYEGVWGREWVLCGIEIFYTFACYRSIVKNNNT